MPELRFRGSDGSLAVVVVNEPEPAPSLFVSPAGADALTFDRAYQRAQPGTVVEVAPGVYPTQTIRAKATTGPPVIFRPPAGQRARLEDLDVYGSHVEFRDLDLDDNWYARPGTRGLTFRNLTGQKFYVRSSEDFKVIGGTYTAPEATGVPTVSSGGSGFPPARNGLIEDVLIYRIWRPEGNTTAHVEGLHIMGVDGLTIRRLSVLEVLGNTSGISFNIHWGSVCRGVLLEDCLVDRTYQSGAYPQPTGQGPSVNISYREPGYEITFRRCRLLDGSPVVPQGYPIYDGAIRFEECVFGGKPNMGLAAPTYVWDYTLEG